MRLQPLHSALKNAFTHFEFAQIAAATDIFYYELEKQFATVLTLKEYSERISLRTGRIQQFFSLIELEQKRRSRTSKSNKQSTVNSYLFLLYL